MHLKRGDVYLANLDPTIGHEQGGTRPIMVISVDEFHETGAELIIGLPLTTKNKDIYYHIPITAKESGLKHDSFVKCEDIRSISIHRLKQYVGSIPSTKISHIEYILKELLGLFR